MTIKNIKKELDDLASPQVAKQQSRFFQTGPEGYGYGDIFIGIRVPDLRKTARKWSHISLNDTKELLGSKVHEHRLMALLILIIKYKTADKNVQENIYRLFVQNRDQVNNWDLVDIATPAIMGAHLFKRSRKILYKWVKSKNLWHRRMSILATFYFIKQDHFDDTLALSALLLEDKEDLIHKAVGWMLRETGKRNLPALESFLKDNYRTMPRTMLRYSIEKLSPEKRKIYMHGKV